MEALFSELKNQVRLRRLRLRRLNHYIKTAWPDAIAAMKQFSETLLCSTCAPDGDIKVKGSVQ